MTSSDPNPIDNLWHVITGLNQFSRAFEVVGNDKVASELRYFASLVQGAIEAHTRETGQLLQMAWDNSENIFRGTLAGHALGSGDAELLDSVGKMFDE